MAVRARDRPGSVPATVLFRGQPIPARVVGGKGAALDRLIGRSIPVPPTGAVTTGTYRAFVDVPQLGDLIGRIRSGEVIASDEVDAAFLSVPFSDELRTQIVTMAREVGGGDRLAVRSSATVEDLAGSSFAGQYRSLLHVDPVDSATLLDAVRLVFASLWHPAPCAYRRAFGIDDGDVEMAVVTMRMVHADTAGVVFTSDPGGRDDAARIEWVDGLGDALVGGERTPEARVVARDLEDIDGPRPILDALRLSLEIERAEGTPQDVEWADDGSTTWIVQARPITVGGGSPHDGFDDPVDDAELTTAGIDEMLPGVFPPLRWQITSLLFNEAFARLVDDLGVGSHEAADDRRFVRRVRGRAAMDFDALRELARRLPGGSVEDLEAQYFGARRQGGPTAPQRDRPGRWSVLRHDVRSLRVRKRASLDAEIVVHAVDALGDGRDVASLTNRELTAYRFRLLDLAVRAAAAELTVASSAASSYRKIELLLAPHLGDVEAGSRTERVTSGHDVTVAPHPAASAAVFAGPTWTELVRSPPTAEELHRKDAASDADEFDSLVATLRTTRSWGDGGLVTAMRTRALRHLVTETSALLRRREATKSALLRLGGEVRRTVLEQGRRLVELDLIDEPADVELLTTGEIDAAFDGQGVSAPVLAGRRRFMDRCRAEPPLPRLFVGVPEPLPVEVPQGGRRLDGWAASAGRYTGIARFVSDADEGLEPGEILVAEATDASWSPLFLQAGAIVVDRGGPLSHAAILARELGIPAVLNVEGASRTLDGRRITVDGDAGIVVLIDAASDDAEGASTKQVRT